MKEPFVSQTIDQIYRDYNTQAAPDSGGYKPKKPEIRALLKQIQNSGGQAVTRNTLTQLNSVTPPNENYMGIVLTGVGAGYYSRVAGVWVFGRGFPDTIARPTVTGGTANTVQASIDSAINPGEVFWFGIVPTLNNTGPMTVSINGAAAKPVVNANGDELTAAEFPAGRSLILTDEGASYRL
jgi:hypothetical protein